MGVIRNISFNDLNQLQNEAIEPVFIYFRKSVYSVSSWYELMKIFFFELYQNEQGKKAIDEYNEKSKAKTCIFSATKELYSYFNVTPIKVAPNLYVGIFSENAAKHNLLAIKDFRLIFTKAFGTFRIYVKKKGLKIPSQEMESFLAEQKQNKRIMKKGKGYVAHINGLILSPWEKLQRRIHKEFRERRLLGDIVLNDQEYDLLRQYMQWEFSVLQNTIRGFTPKDDMAFALGMVLYAQRHYSKRNFWSSIPDEFKVSIDTNRQQRITDLFEKTLKKYNKLYDAHTKRSVDNICMHSFVSTPYAPQLFDYLFDYLRIDLKGSIKNLYGDDGKDKFDILVDEIKRNQIQGVNNLVLHTSLALIHNPVGCKIRLKNYLKLIDSCFWDNIPIPSSNTRLIRLLKEWTENPRGKFQAEFIKTDRKNGGRGKTLLQRPTLYADFASDCFSLQLHQQILPGCSEQEAFALSWRIEVNGQQVASAKPTPLYGKAGIYTEETAVSFDDPNSIFGEITSTLFVDEANGKTYFSKSIKADEIRFFDSRGNYIDYSRGSLPCGTINAYYQNEQPQVLNANFTGYDVGGFGFVTLNVERGDVVVLPNGKALWVGESMDEGLIDHDLVKGAHCEGLPVYSAIPMLFFKCRESDLNGSFMLVNGSKKPWNLAEMNLRHFKLNDAVEDVYGYIINLREPRFGLIDGKNEILIKIRSGKQISLDFFLIKKFAFQFVGAPYVLSQMGKILLPFGTPIIREGKLWGEVNDMHVLDFDLDPESIDNDGFEVRNRQLILPCIVGKERKEIALDIPALYWRYSTNDEWNYEKPEDLPLKKLPNYLYIDGPFDFRSITLRIDLSEQDTDSDGTLNAERTKEGIRYPISQAKSWITDRSVDRISVSIVIDGVEKELFGIQCHSVVTDVQAFGDFEESRIFGNVEIIGDGDYSVSIEGGGLDLKDIPLVDGEFEYASDTPLLEGYYYLRIYENEEDESGWDDNVSIPILREPFVFSLRDVTHLEGTKLKIRSIRYLGKKGYRPLPIDSDEFIYVEKRLNIKEWLKKHGDGDFEFLIDRGIETLQGEHAVLYQGSLTAIIEGEEASRCYLAIIYPSKYNPTDRIILRMNKEEAIDLYYNRAFHFVTPSDRGKRYEGKPWLRYKEIMELIDSKYAINTIVVEEEE